MACFSFADFRMQQFSSEVDNYLMFSLTPLELKHLNVVLVETHLLVFGFFDQFRLQVHFEFGFDHQSTNENMEYHPVPLVLLLADSKDLWFASDSLFYPETSCFLGIVGELDQLQLLGLDSSEHHYFNLNNTTQDHHL